VALLVSLPRHPVADLSVALPDIANTSALIIGDVREDDIGSPGGLREAIDAPLPDWRSARGSLSIGLTSDRANA